MTIYNPSSSSSPLTTKGDIYGHSTVDARIPVGTNGQALLANSGNALGVSWGSVQVPLTFSASVIDADNDITLYNDLTTPGENYYYGTDGSGTKHWLPSLSTLPEGANILAGDGGGGFQSVSIGQGLSYSAPTLSTTGGFYWDSSGDDVYNNNAGNIGINQAAPQAQLHVTPKPTIIVDPANSLSLSFNLSGNPLFTADGTSRSFTVYAYRTDVSPEIFEASGTNNTQTDANDGQGYEADLSWSPSDNATGYIVYYSDSTDSISQYVDVGNVTSVVLDGSTSFSGGTPTLSPTSIQFLTAQFDGPLMNINGVSYTYPSSQGTGYFYDDGSGNLVFQSISPGDILGLAANQVLYGSGGGSIAQSTNFLFDGSNLTFGGDTFSTTALGVKRTNDVSSSGTLNNYATTGISNLYFASPVTITGFGNGYNGKLLYLIAATGTTITLKNQNTGSSLTNRIQNPTTADVVIQPLCTAILQYDSSNDWWNVIGVGKPDVTLLANTWNLAQTFTVPIAPASGGTGSTIRFVTNIALTAQAADITTTNITNGNVAGTYRVSYDLLDTTADATAGVVTLTLAYTDAAGSTTNTTTQVLTGLGRSSGSVYIQLASGSISYATSHTGLFGTAKYALYICLERLS